MKKFILSIAAMAFGALAMTAQSLPNDPAVKVGKLENGLTYYIRHNEKPAGRAEFYLATNVGAIQETPDQDGLAHFLEHMCFNGTKNFPGKGILDYLQSIGASFGGNVNASTGVEQTIYMLNNIPLVRPTVIDTCLLIMHDYAHFVLNDPAEIDKERGVIVEERRARRNAAWRMHEKSLPYYYGNNKYGECTLIGSQENLLNFKPESIVNFYKTWYHPDMQAMIVVGDVDVAYVEAKIAEIFSDIPKEENPKAKDSFPFDEFKDPRIGIITDPEATGINWEVLWEMESTPESMNSSPQVFVMNLVKDVISHVANERLDDIASRDDSPFLNAGLGVGNLSEFIEVVMSQVSAKEGEALPALKAFMIEIEKLRRFGITDDEFNRAKDDILSKYESAEKKADTRQNSQLVYPLINHFFDNVPFMEPKTEHMLANQIFSMGITADVVNQVIPELIKAHNSLVVVYKAPEKEGLVHPTAEQVNELLAEVRNTEIKPNEKEDIPTAFLDPAALKGSKAGKPSTDPFGATVYTLKNGAKVVLYRNDVQKDRVLINLSKEGGESLIPTEDLDSFDETIFGMFLRNTGVASFSGKTVTKMLAGKEVNVTPFVQELRHGISGNSTPKDIETALQLCYLFYTQPRFDAEEYNQGVKQISAMIDNIVNQPDYKFQQHIFKLFYGDNPRVGFISPETLAKANVETVGKNYRKLFADAAGLLVVISGDIDIEALKPLVDKYIGSIPAGKKALKYVDWNTEILPGVRTDDFAVDMETPKSTVYVTYSAPIKYDRKKHVALDAARYILNMRYVTSLREEEGGTYGAQTMANWDWEPKSQAQLRVYFDCKPALADNLREIAEKDLKALASEGPTAEEFDMAKKNLEKNIPEQRETIRYWDNVVRQYHRYGFNRDADHEAAVAALTPEAVKAVLTEILSAGNKAEGILRPATTKEAE